MTGTRVLPDLELIAGLEEDPEWVLFFVPFFGREKILSWPRSFGTWELLTVDEYNAGTEAPDERAMEGIPDAYPLLLAAWVKKLLGFPVALEPDETLIRGPGIFARMHPTPLYWVRRNT